MLGLEKCEGTVGIGALGEVANPGTQDIKTDGLTLCEGAARIKSQSEVANPGKQAIDRHGLEQFRVRHGQACAWRGGQPCR